MNMSEWVSDSAKIGYDLLPDEKITITAYNPQSNPIKEANRDDNSSNYQLDVIFEA